MLVGKKSSNAIDMISSCDKNKDGKVSLDEANSCIDEHFEAGKWRDLAKKFVKRVFKKGDINKDGSLTTEELKEVAKKF